MQDRYQSACTDGRKYGKREDVNYYTMIYTDNIHIAQDRYQFACADFDNETGFFNDYLFENGL